jgi:hypothetical protein
MELIRLTTDVALKHDAAVLPRFKGAPAALATSTERSKCIGVFQQRLTIKSPKKSIFHVFNWGLVEKEISLHRDGLKVQCDVGCSHSRHNVWAFIRTTDDSGVASVTRYYRRLQAAILR